MKIDPQRTITKEELATSPIVNSFEDYPIGSLVNIRHDAVKLDYAKLELAHTLLDPPLWAKTDRWEEHPFIPELIVLAAQAIDERIAKIDYVHEGDVAAVAYSNTGAFVRELSPRDLDQFAWETEETLDELKEFALRHKKWVPVTFLNKQWAGITVALPDIIGKSETYDPQLRENLYDDGWITIQITEKGPKNENIRGLETFAALPSFLASRFPEIEIKRSVRLETTTDLPEQLTVEPKPYLIAEGIPDQIGPRDHEDRLSWEWPAVYAHVEDKHGYDDKDCTIYQFIPLERHTRNANQEKKSNPGTGSFTSLVVQRSVFRDGSNSSLDSLFNWYRGKEILRESSTEIVEVADGSWDSYRYQWLTWLDGCYAISNGFDFILDDDNKVVSNPDLSTFG